MNGFKFEAWPTEFRVINQLFGVNRAFYSRFNLPGHEGLDIKATLGSRLFCVAPGQVKVVHTNPNDHNYGIHVRVSHADGYETIYGHMQQAMVQVNQNVGAGSLLGLAGSTGNSTGPHLHLTLKKAGASQGGFPNNIIDPTPFLFPLLGWQEPAGPYTEGWAFTDALFRFSNLAQATNGGVSLRMAPASTAARIAIIPEGTIFIVNGAQNNDYTPVKVPSVAIGQTPLPPPPDSPPPSTLTTVDGWGFAANIMVSGNQAVVGQFGINLRAAPERNGMNIGLVNAGSTAEVIGSVRGEYLPIRVRRSDFMGPVNLPSTPPVMPNDAPIPADAVLGWGSTAFLTIVGTRATINSQFGINLRSAPAMNGKVLGIAKGFAIATVAGMAANTFTPLLVNRTDILNLVSPLPAVTQPAPLPDSDPTPPPPLPVHDTTPGWAFTAGITINGTEAVADQFGINLRAEPRRNAALKGFVPGGTVMIVTGVPLGEYTPVRIDDDVFQPSIPDGPQPQPNADPPVIGQARIGLHASADPGDLREDEFQEFAAMRPGMIKVLSSHSAVSISRLAIEHPTASWIVRAFLTFRGGRVITPQQFVNDTLGDVERALNQLAGKDVVIELHNEPNLSDEGLGFSWADGGEFGAWWSNVLAIYRQKLPGHRFIYPGLSPGDSIQMPGFRKDGHAAFIEASRAAVDAADGLGVHLYWARDFAMSRALAVLDDYISRFQSSQIWVTEASNNKGGVSPAGKGSQYLHFWTELRQRPNVQGVTYFVASATDPAYAEEVWVGRGIGAVVGQR
ncbi:MAG: peptidoglycan DD-metalloendopeptidase family protein [Candidatus Promineifilaceae bacterium]